VTARDRYAGVNIPATAYPSRGQRRGGGQAKGDLRGNRQRRGRQDECDQQRAGCLAGEARGALEAAGCGAPVGRGGKEHGPVVRHLKETEAGARNHREGGEQCD
jgi:hypothetical protein